MMVVYIRQLNYSKFSSENTVLYIVGPYRTFVSTTFYSNRIVMKSRKSFICILQSIANEKSHLKARTYSILSIKKRGEGTLHTFTWTACMFTGEL